MISDLISAFLFGLHAIPYCGGYVATECATEASAFSQLMFTLALLPFAGLLKHLAESTKLTERPGMWDDIPMILKYIVGWAFGGYCQQVGESESRAP